MPVLQILSSVARELLGTLFFDFKFLPIYILLIFLIKNKYNMYLEVKRQLHRKQEKTIRQIIEETILTSLVTGFIGSFVVVWLGITMDVRTVEYLILIMIFLGLINLRYLCFSYAAGIFAVINLLFGITDVNITHLLALAAFLQLLESILVYINGGRDSVPVFIKHKDTIAGAFVTQKIWPIPIVFFTYLTALQREAGFKGFELTWDTLFTPGAAAGAAGALALDCLVTVLNYSDISITAMPKRKNRLSALMMFIYSLILMLVAYLSNSIYEFRYIGAAFLLLGHEAITQYGRWREKVGEPLFKAEKRGLKVFDVLPESHAENMGIQRGDTILKVNGKDIQTPAGMEHSLKDYPVFVWVTVKDCDGNEKTYEYKRYPDGINELGVVIVPREQEVTYNMAQFENLVIVRNIVSRFRNSGKI